MKQILLSDDRKDALVRDIQASFMSEFDETISDFQAVQDVRAHLQIKLDDLDGEIYVDQA